MFNGKINYKSPFSMAFCMFTRPGTCDMGGGPWRPPRMHASPPWAWLPAERGAAEVPAGPIRPGEWRGIYRGFIVDL